ECFALDLARKHGEVIDRACRQRDFHSGMGKCPCHRSAQAGTGADNERGRVTKRGHRSNPSVPIHAPSAFLTRSGVIGLSRRRTPVSGANAAAMAGATSGVAIWPTPVG